MYYPEDEPSRRRPLEDVFRGRVRGFGSLSPRLLTSVCVGGCSCHVWPRGLSFLLLCVYDTVTCAVSCPTRLWMTLGVLAEPRTRATLSPAGRRGNGVSVVAVLAEEKGRMRGSVCYMGIHELV